MLFLYQWFTEVNRGIRNTCSLVAFLGYFKLRNHTDLDERWMVALRNL